MSRPISNNRFYVWLASQIIAGFILAGCSSESSPATDAALDSAPAIDTAQRQQEQGPGDQALEQADVQEPELPLQEIRAIIHLHSINSWDACDLQPYIDGQPNLPCLADLRQAICDHQFDYVSLSDHPDTIFDHTMSECLLFDAQAGDVLQEQDNKPVANQITCPGGKKVLVSAGMESMHQMPIGYHFLPAAPTLFEVKDDPAGTALLTSQVQTLKQTGAVTSVVHSEAEDITAPMIDAAGFEAMEWYNIHANMMAVLGGDKLQLNAANLPQLTALVSELTSLGSFLEGTTDGPYPDLIYLQLLDFIPQAGFNKWHAVQQHRRITGLLGSDIHQNLVVDASVCAGALQGVCAAALSWVESSLGWTIPQVVKSLLLEGGHVNLNDGKRIDSYERMLGWLENRLLVTAVDLPAIQDALRRGRSYGVFTVFGDPAGFSFTATQDERTLQLGDSASGPLTLQVTLPARPVFLYGAPFSETEALQAEITTRVFRTDSAGTTLVEEREGLGAEISLDADQPGAYHVEVWIRPLHLQSALAEKSALADKEYLWVITNPITRTQ